MKMNVQSTQHTLVPHSASQVPFGSCSGHSYLLRKQRGRRRGAVTRAESGFTSPSFWDSGPLKRQKQVITLLTADGFVTLPSWSDSEVPRRLRVEPAPLPTADEQGLCLGACFTIAATNGADPSRRLAMLGFCRSVNDLSEVVEDAVLSRGGKIVVNQIELKSGLHEFLKMTVAIPLLNGVPPQHEYLRSAISSGGGIVERMYRQWQMYG